jgi:hypothetical protein
MIYFLRRINDIHRQAVVTLVVASAGFFLTLAPTLALPVAKAIIKKPTGTWSMISSFITPMQMAYTVNCAANPFIYCITVRSFAAFLRLKLTSARNQLVILFRIRCRCRRRTRIADLASRV